MAPLATRERPGRRTGELVGGPDRLPVRRPELLDQAMAHRSWCAEQPGRTSNERLEYLGDAVLGLVVAEYTYRNHPELSDGAMSKVRASVVNTRVLAEVALELGIAEHLRLGRGEDLSGGRAKESILADATEAVIGAVYLDGGLVEAERADPLPAQGPDRPGRRGARRVRPQEPSPRAGRAPRTGCPPLRGGGFGARSCPAGTWPRCTLLASASARGRGGPRRTPSRWPPRSACGSLEVERGGGNA